MRPIIIKKLLENEETHEKWKGSKQWSKILKEYKHPRDLKRMGYLLSDPPGLHGLIYRLSRKHNWGAGTYGVFVKGSYRPIRKVEV